MPFEGLPAQQLVQGHIEALDGQGAVHAHRNQLRRKAVNVRVLSRRAQSNQETSLFWQKALLLPP